MANIKKVFKGKETAKEEMAEAKSFKAGKPMPFAKGKKMCNGGKAKK